MFKPFKPPLQRPAHVKIHTVDLTHIQDSNSDTNSDLGRPAKKRKLLVRDVIPDSPPKKILDTPAVNAPRQPLRIKNDNEPKPNKPEYFGPEGYYRVLW